MTRAEIKMLMGAVAPVIREFVAAEIAKVTTPLREEISELQARPTLRYVGVYDRSGSYGAGAAATHKGSLWIAKHPTAAEPGTSNDWQLAVKRGRDGKDARRRSCKRCLRSRWTRSI